MFLEILKSEQFWVLVAFVIFILAVFKPIKNIVSSNLDKKINEIKNNINEAEKLKSDAQFTLSETKKRQNEVKKEIEKINLDIKEKIRLIEESSKRKFDEQIEKRSNLTTIKIEQMTRDAKNEIHNYIVETSLAAASNLLEKKLNDEERQKLINNSINELNSIFKN